MISWNEFVELIEDTDLLEEYSCGCEICESIMAEEALQEKGGDISTSKKSGNFRSTESGAGMTKKGVEAFKRKNPGSKLKTAVTGDVKPGSKAAGRRKSFCARSRGWTGERGKAARRRWKC